LLRCWMPMAIGLWMWMNTGLWVRWYWMLVVGGMPRVIGLGGWYWSLGLGGCHGYWVLGESSFSFIGRSGGLETQVWCTMNEWYVMICHNGWVSCESGASMTDARCMVMIFNDGYNKMHSFMAEWSDMINAWQ
jgi:hypothetical protein